MLKNQLTQRWRLPKTWLSFLIITSLVLGIFFRLTNLEGKVYWFDETFTSLRISGYTEAEVVQHFQQTQIIGIQDLQNYQHLNPERSLIDTIKSLSLEDPQHPPLYYVIARFWAQWFGTSVTAMRSLPALISLLVFPSIYWLCLELFQSPLTKTSHHQSPTPSPTPSTTSPTPSAAHIGWVAMAIIAVSPFHVLYAQEAREYSLWTVTILLSSATLLRAIRLKTKVSWGIYAVTLAISFYTFLFSGLVAIGHGIYIATLQRYRLTKTTIAYQLATLSAIIIFIPWILVVATNLHQIHNVTEWVTRKQSLLQLVSRWAMTFSRIFIDFNISLSAPLLYKITLGIVILILLFLLGYSLYFLCINTPKRIWLFILTLIGVTAIALILPDLVVGGKRSTMPRYLIPIYLGIQLSFAYLIATKLSHILIKSYQDKLWQLVLIAVVSMGVLSCTISYQAEVWWTKILNIDTPAIAHIINQTPHPLLISDDQMPYFLTFSYLLDPKVQLIIQPKCYTCNLNSQLAVKPYIPQIPDGFTNVFLYNPTSSRKWIEELKKQQKYKLKLVYTTPDDKLWELEKQ